MFYRNGREGRKESSEVRAKEQQTPEPGERGRRTTVQVARDTEASSKLRFETSLRTSVPVNLTFLDTSSHSIGYRIVPRYSSFLINGAERGGGRTVFRETPTNTPRSSSPFWLLPFRKRNSPGGAAIKRWGYRSTSSR